MQTFRRLVFANRRLVVVLFALALAMKLLVPTGFMPVRGTDGITITLCSGTGSTSAVMTIPRGVEGDMGAGDQGTQSQPPCAFAGLSLPSVAAADPIVLAIALLFIMALAQQALPVRRTKAPAYTWPPLRGPPAHT